MRQRITLAWASLFFTWGWALGACSSADTTSNDPFAQAGGSGGATGGSGSMSGGAPGGAAPSGGSSSGGAPSGGGPSGGSGSGGSPSGGASTGGIGTGGIGTGGTGGASTGGQPGGGTGGTPTGGGTGGSGGASTGGAPTGGTGTGGQPGTNGIPWLHTEGNQIKDPQGNTVVLRGVANISIGALEDWEDGVVNMIDRLTNESDGWYARVLRLAVYPSDEESFDNSKLSYKPDQDFDGYYNWVLRPAIDRCAEHHVYCIIDWHYIDDTSDHVQSTTTFWTNVASRFANDSNVLFELFNEPVDAGDWPTLRSHMQSWYDTVRQSAPDNLVLVGTPSWDQEIGATVSDPIDGTNIAYVSHTYPLHWNWPEHVQQIQDAAAVHPVFVTEWGYQTPTGGANDIVGGTTADYAQPWRQFVDGLGLSWTAWVASDTWTPPLFTSGGGGLTEFGQFTQTWLSDTRDQDRPADL